MGFNQGPKWARKKVVRRAPSRPSPEAGSAGKTSGQRRQTSRVRYRQIAKARPQKKIRAKGRVSTDVIRDRPGPLRDYVLYKAGRRAKPVSEQAADLKVISPALKVLNQTTRLSHGIAGATDVALGGGGFGAQKGAFGRGVANKDKTNFGDVLRHAGAPKGVSNVAGFGLDVATDPLTYVSFGTGSVAKKVAAHEADRVALKAAKAGMSEAGQKTVARAAYRKTLESAPQGHGVTAAFAGKQAPGVTRATAAVGRKAGKVIPSKPASAVKHGLGDVNPNIAPEGVSKELHSQARMASRKARATAERGRATGEMQARAIHRTIGEDSYNQVVDAIEAGKIRSLPDHLHQPAVALRSIYRGMRRSELRAGVPVPKLRTKALAGEGNVAKEYVPRSLAPEDAKATITSQGARVVKADFGKARKTHVPMAELRDQGTYSSDLPLLHVTRAAKGARAKASAQLNQHLAQIGRAVKPGKEFTAPHDGEALYRLRSGGAKLEEVPEKDWGRVAAGKIRDGRFFILPRQVEAHARGTLQMPEHSSLGTAYDTAQRGFKRVATATPGFHVRNLVGDTWNAYLEQPGHKLPGNLARSSRMVKAVSKGEAKSRKQLLPKVASDKGLQIPDEGFKTYKQLGEEFIATGAGRTGYIGRELEELGRGAKAPKTGKIRTAAGKVTGGKVGSTKASTGRFVRRQMQNREDLARGATWLHYRLKGLSAEQAATKSAEAHFDYSELTPFERKYARRIAPFWTFSARNIPLQSRKLVQRPGKFATLQKAREESGIGKVEGKLSEYDQRQLPLAIAGGARSVSLPAVDLNEFPGAAGGPVAQGREYGNRFAQLVSPIIKNPVEYASNYSFFFRDAIERPQSPLVAAPSWVQHLPGPLKKRFGVTDSYVDKRTGRKTWGWYGKADYVSKQLPGIPNFAQNITTVSNRRGQSQAEKATAFLTGVKSTPLDKTTFQNVALGDLYKRQDKIIRRQRALNQQGVNAKNPTREYTKLSAQAKQLRSAIYANKSKQKFKVLPKSGGPKKAKGGYGSDGYGSSGYSKSGY